MHPFARAKITFLPLKLLSPYKFIDCNFSLRSHAHIDPHFPVTLAIALPSYCKIEGGAKCSSDSHWKNLGTQLSTGEYELESKVIDSHLNGPGRLKSFRARHHGIVLGFISAAWSV